jgi:hypothetical protein
MNIISPDKYIIDRICTYPTLHALNTFEESKMRVLDQLLNVLGNGIRDDDELLEELSFKTNHTLKDAQRWIKGKIVYGYTQTEGEGVLTRHKGKSVEILECDLKKHLEIIYSFPSPKHPFQPYPNFQKKYSTVWKCPIFLTFGNAWISFAIEFYKYCLAWLQKNELEYHYAFPRPTQEETEERIKEFIISNEKKSKAQIAKDYSLTYTEDVHDLLSRRWQRDKINILKFMDETLQMLSEKMSQ